jgi:hypothetical protein
MSYSGPVSYRALVDMVTGGAILLNCWEFLAKVETVCPEIPRSGDDDDDDDDSVQAFAVRGTVPWKQNSIAIIQATSFIGMLIAVKFRL